MSDAAKPRDSVMTQLLSHGLAVPSSRFSQTDLMKMLSLHEPRSRRFFEHGHIQHRHLVLPPDGKEESMGVLLRKFKEHSLSLGAQAIRQALQEAKIGFEDVDFLCCVSSTGFLVPGLSALFIEGLGFRRDCQRVDVVGMGCNAGLNALNAVVSWSKSNPGKFALLVCAEICAAIYCLDGSEGTALVNSLFGDGVAALLVKSDLKPETHSPCVLGFSSRLLPDSLDSLRFDWDDTKCRFKFFIGKETPKLLASQVAIPMQDLLDRNGLKKAQIRHWIAHTGGAAILDGIQEKLGLAEQDLRHTRSVLRDYGNLSSGSFIFSYSRLLEEGRIRPGDHGIMMTMGPGLTIEMALLGWPA